MISPQQTVEDDAFVSEFMYHGRGSNRPWMLLAGMLAASAFFVVGSLWLYHDIAAWEDAGQPERWENALVVLLYELGGKELVRAVGIGIGVVAGTTGVTAYARARAARSRSLGRSL